MNNCKHKLLKRKVNNTADLPNPELIQIWDLREGDYNDVYSSIDVRGTMSQLYEMCLERVKNQGNRNIDQFGDSDNFGYQIYNKYGDVQFYVSADSQGTDKTDLRSWTSFVDLVKDINEPEIINMFKMVNISEQDLKKDNEE